MLIATYNVNSIRARLDAVLGWLAADKPDILCVQETKVEDALFPCLELEAVGYHATFKGMKAYNGVAILSRRAPDEWSAGFDDGGPADEFRLLRARFGDLTVVNTYVPQGREITHEMYRYKIEWLGRLRRWFDRHHRTDQRLLWTGDLNVARTPIDVHEPEKHLDHVCYHEDVRKAFENTIAWGFVDVFRKHHPEPGLFSFFDYRTPNAVKRKIGWRIDYLLASPPLAAACTRSWIDLAPRLAPKASDHTVVAGEFECETSNV